MNNVFIDNKYTRWYYNIIKNPDQTGFTERHHITPDSFYKEGRNGNGRLPGDPDESHNIVYVSLRQHYILHLLLPKMVVSERDERKMIHALIMMSKTRKGLIMKNSRLYEKMKSRLKKMEKRNHYYNKETDEVVILYDDECVPEGFVKGGRPKSEGHKKKIGIGNTGVPKTGLEGNKDRRHYYNSITGEGVFVNPKDAPIGEGWMQGTSTTGVLRGTLYHNPDTLETKVFKDLDTIPDNWVQGMVPDEVRLEQRRILVRNMQTPEARKKLSKSRKGQRPWHHQETLVEHLYRDDETPPEGFIRGKSPKNIRSGHHQTEKQKEAARKGSLREITIDFNDGHCEMFHGWATFFEKYNLMSPQMFWYHFRKGKQPYGVISYIIGKRLKDILL